MELATVSRVNTIDLAKLVFQIRVDCAIRGVGGCAALGASITKKIKKRAVGA